MAGWTDKGKRFGRASRGTSARVMSPLIGPGSEQLSQRLSRICQALLPLVRMAKGLDDGYAEQQSKDQAFAVPWDLLTLRWVLYQGLI